MSGDARRLLSRGALLAWLAAVLVGFLLTAHLPGPPLRGSLERVAGRLGGR